MKIIFMGTQDFSVPVLEALHQAHEIVAVYSQPPRPAGRGKADRPSPVQARAMALGLPVRHPVSLRSEDAAKYFAALGADVAVVVAYGLILPQEILDAPRLGCLNIHASLLPRWRGAAPIHRAIMAGDSETGVCIMQMEAGLDTGPVLLRESLMIGAEETTADLHDRLSALGARLSASRARGSVTGRGASGDLIVDWIDLKDQLEVGEVVLTSGLGGDFPQDIVIGRVVQILRNEADLFQQAIVQPATDFDTLEIVLVVTDFTPIDTTIFESPTEN